MLKHYPGHTEPPMAVLAVPAAGAPELMEEGGREIIEIRIEKEICVQDIKCLSTLLMLDGTIGLLLHQVNKLRF